jgi:hypothetical protein
MHGSQQTFIVQATCKPARGLHGPDGMGTGRANACLEQLKQTDSHFSASYLGVCFKDSAFNDPPPAC